VTDKNKSLTHTYLKKKMTWYAVAVRVLSRTI